MPLLRCEGCRSSVDAPGAAPHRWIYALTDHLLDLHREQLHAGQTADIRFTGAGVQVRVEDGKVVT